MARTAEAVQVDKATAQSISAEIVEAARKILAKHGLEAKAPRTGYGSCFSFKIEAEAVKRGRNGVNIASKEAQLFAIVASDFGLTTDDLGAVITYDGKEMTLTGALDSFKFPFHFKDAQGRGWKLPNTELVKLAIKAAR
jgi:hypothetical protein